MSTSIYRRTLSAAAWLLCAASALGCAGLKPPLTSPAHGGAPWIVISSRHFVLSTDLDASDARAALSEFESSYQALEDINSPGSAPVPFRMQIVEFARDRDFRQFAPDTAVGYFVPELPNDFEASPTMVFSGAPGDQTRLIFQHELAHHFIQQSLGPTPLWLNEGLAQFYSTFRVEGDYGYIGQAVPDRIFIKEAIWRSMRLGSFDRMLIPAGQAPPVADLIGMSRGEFYAPRSQPSEAERRRQAVNYTSAWVLVHMLINGPAPYRARFSKFLEAASHGAPVREAFDEAFSDVPPERFEEDYRAYLVGMRYIEKRGPVVLSTPATPENERVMTDAEVHVLWVRLKRWRRDNAAWVEAHLNEALGSAPNDPDVHFWRGRLRLAQGRYGEADQELTAALAAKPREPRYLFGMAVLLSAMVNTHRLVETAATARVIPIVGRLRGTATTAAQLDFVARYLLDQHKLEEVRSFVARAIKTDPGCAGCYDTYAMLLLEEGRLDEAARAESHAIDLLPETVHAPNLDAHLRCIHAYAKAARKGTPPPAQRCNDVTAR